MAGLGLQLRLTHKIAALGVVGMLGLAALMTMYLVGSRRLDHFLQASATAEKLLVNSTDLNAAFLESRRAEKDFLLRSDLKYAARHAELATSIKATLDDLRNTAAALPAPELAGYADKIGDGFNVYSAKFKASVDLRRELGLDEKSGLEGRLREAVHNVETTLKDVAEPKLTILMLMMRRHEKDFMLRRDKKYGVELQARVAEFLAALDDGGLPAATKPDLKAKIEAYQRDFIAWMNGALRLADELKATSEAYSTIEPEIGAMLKSVRDLYAEAGEASQRVTAETRRQILVSASLIAVLMLAASFLLGRAVSRPLGAITRAMVALARGDLQAHLPGIGRRDEIGAIADALVVFRDQAIEKNRLTELQEAARGEAIEIRKRATQDMAGVVETETRSAVKAVGDTARDVREAAEEMSQFASAVSVDTQSVAAASEEALVSAQTVSSAAEELTASIQEINLQVSRTADVARRAVASGEIATTTVRSLTDAVSKISEVTKLIGDVASQTNLLALNATIEAARAGEAGRGFAVVASEVKHLAAQTARSTEDINRQVAEIQAVSASAVDAMTDVGIRIGEIDASTTAILSAIEQQAAATQEITRNVSETTASAQEVSSRIQNVSAGAVKVGNQANSVRRSIGEITDNIAGLQAVLVRVVRTSTEDADRRRSKRYPVTAKAEVCDASRRPLLGDLVDMSETGAQIGCSSGMHVGDKGSLQLAELSSPLPFVVRGQQADALHVEFELSDAQRASFSRWFNQRVGTPLAVAS
jgi:methyl-accepting chemotaxis protein